MKKIIKDKVNRNINIKNNVGINSSTKIVSKNGRGNFAIVIIGTTVVVCIISIVLAIFNASSHIRLIDFRNENAFENELNIYSINLNEAEKVSSNLPKIETTETFGKLLFSICETLYNKESYENECTVKTEDEIFRDLINDKADIVISAMPKNEILNIIKDNSSNIVFEKVCKEAAVLFTNKDSEINSLSINEIAYMFGKDSFIYEENKDNNGLNKCAKVISQNNEANSGINEVCGEFKEKLLTVNTTHDAVNEVINGSAISFAFKSYFEKVCITDKIKYVSVEGVEPINENIQNDSYPMIFDVYLVYKQENENNNVIKIIDFLKSEKGKELIEKNGYYNILEK